MSGVNGDKARFHRDRKKRIAQRERNRKLFKIDAGQPKSSTARSSKPNEKVA
jgi:hypothetical protein